MSDQIENFDREVNEAWASGKPEQMTTLLSWQFLAYVVGQGLGGVMTKEEFMAFLGQQGAVSGPFELLHMDLGENAALTVWSVPTKQHDQRWEMQRTYSEKEEGWQLVGLRIFPTS